MSRPLDPDLDPGTLDPVLAQAPYVRALARELVFDAHLARDVEQEVLLAALEHGPRERGALRGWLFVVARNAAVKAWRSSGRRAQRERAVARPEASVPSPAEILEREDRRRHLVEHVLALEEPLRAVLVLRFLEELPPRAVARRLGLPVETVRSRTRRGLELLRARLDRESRGRSAWCLALVRAFRLPVGLSELGPALIASSLSGGIAMSLSKKVAAAVVALALLGSVAFLWQRNEARGDERRVSESVRLAPVPAALAPDLARESVPSSAVETERETLATSRATAELASTGSMLLRITWHDGEPAAEVAATARASQSQEGDQEGAELVTNDQGIARLAGLPPGKVSVQVDRCSEFWSALIVPGEEAELLVTLPRGCDVTGTVTFAGAPVSAAEIWLGHSFVGWGGHRVARTDAQGRYRVRSIDEGVYSVRARAPGLAPTPRAEFLGGTGATLEVPLEFTHAGGVLEGRVVDSDGQPLDEAYVLVGDEIDQRFGAQRTRCDALGFFRFEGVEPGLWPVRARAPGRARWSGEIEIVAGITDTLSITLCPGATVRGIVRDGAGRPVPHARVRCGRGLFGDRSQFAGADGAFELHDLPAGEFELVAESDAHGRVHAIRLGAADAELVWNPVLAGASLRGRLVLNGLDPAQCTVRCEGEGAENPYLGEVRPDASGAFEFAGLTDPAYRLEVRAGDVYAFPLAEQSGVLGSGEEIVLALDPARWPSIRLRGRVVDGQGQPLPGVTVIPKLAGQSSSPLLTTSTAGTFDMGPYPPGKWGVLVRSTGEAQLRTPLVELGPDETWDFGDVVLRP